MDVASFREDLICALGRPEEWCVGDGENFLVHSRTGTMVYPHGSTSVVSPSGFRVEICHVPRRTVSRCWVAVSERNREARSKEESRSLQRFLRAFQGFRS
ncbi:hypothetical protein LCGC14_2242730 [marine sediment metagenome]|uniref:Uncharacterized protein n=1 Tax=marine sediment metagenome TaxID=412755 RepID=A0A0F9D536_9ZZZZ